MKDVAVLLNGMRDAGVILDYALFGAVAQLRYTEAVATLDADVRVAVPSPDRLDVLDPIYEYCRTRGYVPEGEAVRVGAWPVQFVLLECGAVSAEAVRVLAQRHGLHDAWTRFRSRFLDDRD